MVPRAARGRPPEEYHVQREMPLELFRPEAGLPLIFPAYLYHRTIPYAADERGISIAFDLVTEAAGSLQVEQQGA